MGILEYHRSINDELTSVQSRIRNLLEPGMMVETKTIISESLERRKWDK